jgi:hypothetical protein
LVALQIEGERGWGNIKLNIYIPVEGNTHNTDNTEKNCLKSIVDSHNSIIKEKSVLSVLSVLGQNSVNELTHYDNGIKQEILDLILGQEVSIKIDIFQKYSWVGDSLLTAWIEEFKTTGFFYEKDNKFWRVPQNG